MTNFFETEQKQGLCEEVTFFILELINRQKILKFNLKGFYKSKLFMPQQF